MTTDRPRSRRHLATAGVLSGAVFFASGWLTAVLLDPPAAPHAALGATVVDLTPPWLKDFAVEAFGTGDKAALFVVMGLVSIVLAGFAGILAGRSRRAAVVAVLALATVCALAAGTRPDTSAMSFVPALVAAASGVATLLLLVHVARSSQLDEHGPGRRRFLSAAAGAGALAVALAAAGSVLARARSSVMGARETIVLPEPAHTPDEATAARIDASQVELSGMPDYVTANEDFYRIDTALRVPQLDPAQWELRVHGMVDEEVRIDYAELLDSGLTEAMVTLTCVSNRIGGTLVGNASWLGLPVRSLLSRAGVRAGADMVLSTSADGWKAGTPLEALTDERNALLAVGMNGQPLPLEHGFPVRMVVPGLYGYVSATKWVTDLKVTTFADDEGYWTPRGWSARGPVRTASRIDVPRSGATVPPGEVRLGGTAWAQQRGITRVQVQIDDDDWRDAELVSTVSIDTWRQWAFTWPDATPGRHEIRCRAWDDNEVQTAEVMPPAPSGATGHHVISLVVE
ncbi:molybdopterin-dependent oxidoreductase [Ruania alkalisoli]|uniref:Molybdopterin-dependent oxidoreductase n=1 Tax=Ruania alkalisoli TaxID=2779775 RepID=A0A7M1SQ10_9MICO|nr:molybdopterin-dependent oxidoreductase [Ruania alkalisoli]QOR69094.1 molybdopterin-dependent oxidoreductase [Ruania alkalisoli]